jgi:phenylacetate-CoA ligase
MTSAERAEHFVWGRTLRLDRDELQRGVAGIVADGKRLARDARVPSSEDLRSVFGRLVQIWSDPHHPIRASASKVLGNAGLGEALLRESLGALPRLLDPEALVSRMARDLASPSGEGLPGEPRWRLLVRPVGQVLHVSAGNTFLGGVESLVNGMITGNVNYLKTAEGDPAFPLLFARSVAESDPEGLYAGRLAVLSWRGGDEAIETLFKREMDAIIFYGGAGALAQWQGGLGPGTTLIPHGPRMGIGVVSQLGCRGAGLRELAQRIALDVSIWEQRACNSLHTLFLQAGQSAESEASFIEALAASLDRMAKVFPADGRSMEEDVEVLRARELARAARITGRPVSVQVPAGGEWTVIRQGAAEPVALSPLGRTLLLRTYVSLGDLVASLVPHESHLQTAGYCLDASELQDYATALATVGVTRLCPFGVMTLPPPGSPHEGRLELRDLSKLVVVEEARSPQLAPHR